MREVVRHADHRHGRAVVLLERGSNVPVAGTELRNTSSSSRSTCPPLRPLMRSTTVRIRASPPGSKKRVITRRISLVKVTGKRSDGQRVLGGSAVC